MKSGYDVILKPIITEQSMDMSADKKYVFKVADTANKTEVRQAVEEVFGVDVAKVNIMNVNGKVKRMGRTVRRQSLLSLRIAKRSKSSRDCKIGGVNNGN